MKRILLCAALALAIPALAHAQQAPTPQEKGLSAPVVALMPVLMKNGEALGLDAAQKAALDAWMATAPQKRGALEDETVTLRAEMQAAILAGAPVRRPRDPGGEDPAPTKPRLIMMRSGCRGQSAPVADRRTVCRLA